jgi:hypothetical protein
MGTHHWVVGSAVAISLAFVGVDTLATADTRVKGRLKATYEFLGAGTEVDPFQVQYYECDELRPGAPSFHEWVTGGPLHSLDWWSISGFYHSYLYIHCGVPVRELTGNHPYLPVQDNVVTYMNIRFNVRVTNLARGWSEENCPDGAIAAAGYQDAPPAGGTIEQGGYDSVELGYLWSTWDVKYYLSSSIWGDFVPRREKPVAEFSRMICGPDPSTPSGIGVQIISTTLTLPEISRWPR